MVRVGYEGVNVERGWGGVGLERKGVVLYNLCVVFFRGMDYFMIIILILLL